MESMEGTIYGQPYDATDFCCLLDDQSTLTSLGEKIIHFTKDWKTTYEEAYENETSTQYWLKRLVDNELKVTCPRKIIPYLAYCRARDFVVCFAYCKTCNIHYILFIGLLLFCRKAIFKMQHIGLKIG
jgi:hypothetical protein